MTSASPFSCPAYPLRVAGYQDFAESAPLELVDVALHARMSLAQRDSYSWLAVGAMAQTIGMPKAPVAP